jgi:hypothetical protein
MKNILRLLSLGTCGLLIGSSLSSCIIVADTSDTTTTGRELGDLKTALDEGAITKSEFEAQKARILNGQ